MFLCCPAAQVDELAALGAKGPVWIFRRPLYSLIAGWAVVIDLSTPDEGHPPDGGDAADHDRWQ